MKNSIKEELVNYLMELTYKRVLNDGNRRDWYYYAFQEEDYIKTLLKPTNGLNVTT